MGTRLRSGLALTLLFVAFGATAVLLAGLLLLLSPFLLVELGVLLLPRLGRRGWRRC